MKKESIYKSSLNILCVYFFTFFAFFFISCQCEQYVAKKSIEKSSIDSGLQKEQMKENYSIRKEINSTESMVCIDGKERECYDGNQNVIISPCQKGIQTCKNSRWGKCNGQILPKQEECNGLDDNCDGKIDSPSPVLISCYFGPKGTETLGQCKKGFYSCEKGKLKTCKQQKTPVFEVCDNADNDCDGMVDEDGICKEILPVKEMILIPAGEFSLGTSQTQDSVSLPNERPKVLTYLSAFSIDSYEVSNIDYKQCVISNRCSPIKLPKKPSEQFPKSYLTSNKYDLFPVIGVTWRQARSYCIWKKRTSNRGTVGTSGKNHIGS